VAIVRWAPFDTADGLHDLVRRAFGNPGGDFGSSLLQGRAGSFSPALEAFVRDNEMHVRLELPGIDPDKDVDIEVSNGVLSVSGERKHEATEQADGFYRREMSYGRFERNIALPEGTDASQLRASYDAGILDIAVPLPTKEKTKVKVEVGNQKQLES
jgi:HSP20 family protein